MTTKKNLELCLVVGSLSFLGCGDDGVCDPVAQEGCDEGLVCAEIEGEEDPACFVPVVIRGQVFDLGTGDAVAGARVMALDVNRAPASSVAITDDSGSYELAIPSTRDPNGVPTGVELTLRAEAAGYQTFPGGLRQALPVDTGAVVDEGDAYVLESTLTTIGLIALEQPASGIISGNVEMPDDGSGVLVVAGEHSTFADREGEYVIFNVPDGDYDVAGYTRGVSYSRAQVSVAGDEVTADLSRTGDPTSTLTGKVELANPGDGAGTSVILVVASTFDSVLLRGANPPGLRAPEPGVSPDVSGTFTIEGVPDGDYKVLAAFENDFMVRDPDTCIAGTDILEQSFAGGGEIDMTDSGFKVTGALDVVGPGAGGAEGFTSAPTLSWEDDSSEAGYRVRVFDAFGEEVWNHDEPSHSGTTPEVPYEGPFETGMYYQFRVTSFRTTGGGTTECEISTTEDLEGVFFAE